MNERRGEWLDPRPARTCNELAKRPGLNRGRKLMFFDNGKLRPPYARWLPIVRPVLDKLETMGQVVEYLQARNITFAMARAHLCFIEWLERYALVDKIGKAHFYMTNRDAVEAYCAETGTSKEKCTNEIKSIE